MATETTTVVFKTPVHFMSIFDSVAGNNMHIIPEGYFIITYFDNPIKYLTQYSTVSIYYTQDVINKFSKFMTIEIDYLTKYRYLVNNSITSVRSLLRSSKHKHWSLGCDATKIKRINKKYYELKMRVQYKDNDYNVCMSNIGKYRGNSRQAVQFDVMKFSYDVRRYKSFYDFYNYNNIILGETNPIYPRSNVPLHTLSHT